ncbi:MAG: ATP-binding protein [Candidatus Manganitrophus sp.]|nr:ATP-binding protein [Candidatus Manganitrophus sp.]MDC4227779.1 ATP-binding protein [Candidatus Manganitrophus sp.]WDT70874.1 MAG: ATP-binding protein [Candidatus Manganitrophus sp.]WDT81855.1 MAG: ATP-binding protein [Candidatus Manganitrophus sp.]
MTDPDTQFSFEISLSVLNHLGRQLYRSFATVLGEAISNSWDADAKNVKIYVDRQKGSFFIKDDGVGMTPADFQDKFLKIGYSKRKSGAKASPSGRPFIGRKGIGKLALLSCADKIVVISKTKDSKYIGGVIDNSKLDRAITEDLTPKQCPLGQWKPSTFRRFTKGHKHGTIIYFEGVKEGIRGSFDFLSKIIALYFRFSLLDDSFNIFLDDEQITYKHLDDLAQKTEFLWIVGETRDPYVDSLRARFSKSPGDHETKHVKLASVTGFVASVEKPRDLKIMTTEERVGIDLFVNGRLRERDILKHIPTARVAESYLYGQIHFDSLDDGTDRFTSSREGIVADDPKYGQFLVKFRERILKIVEDWDRWRIKHREEGDPDNERLTKKERASHGLYGAVSKEYGLSKGKKNRGKVGGWVDELAADAAFNFESYAECFISENLVRKFIKERKLPLSKEAIEEAGRWKKAETDNKNKGNISIRVRRIGKDPHYLSMDFLANLVDKKDPIKEACLARDAKEYKPMRDAVAHTALLTEEAKSKLTSVHENIKGRVRTLLAGQPKQSAPNKLGRKKKR